MEYHSNVFKIYPDITVKLCERFLKTEQATLLFPNVKTDWNSRGYIIFDI